MPAQIIDGKQIAAEIREEVGRKIAALPADSPKPALCVILVGDDPASQVYVRSKGRACEKAGIYSETHHLNDDISEEELLQHISEINEDPKWHGLLIQLPLPDHINTQRIIEAVAPEKDVDCFHPFNVGRLVIGEPVFSPATPAGIVELLTRSRIETSGKHLVVIGRSNIVGKPLANLMVQKKANANAIVTLLHSAAGDLTPYTRQADILVAAIGRPEFVTAGMVKDGATVIDVGINRVAADNPKGYRLCGDVDFAAVSKKAAFITPVPGGVGPMTIALLLKNTLTACLLQSSQGS